MNPFILYTIQRRLAMATYAMWLGATHIRLLPLSDWSAPSSSDWSAGLSTSNAGSYKARTFSKEPPLQISIREAAEPAPILTDVRAAVREALRVALAWPPPHSDSAELIHKALAALDQEKTSDE